MASSAVLSLSWPPQQGAVADSFWVSLKYFNFYRVAVAAMFLLAALVYGDDLGLGSHDLNAFVYTCVVYLALAVAFHFALRKVPGYFNVQLTLHVVSDIAVVVVLMYASSGIRSGLGVMLLISLAGAALVSRGMLVLFYAALASIAVLLEQSYWVLVQDSSTANYLQPGLLSIGFFVTALITNQLARRLILNERLARQRGADLADQLRINRLISRDVQDGVLVVDANGLVHQHNPRAADLVGRFPPELSQIEEYSEELAHGLAAWRAGEGASSVNMRFAESGRLVRARFLAAGVAGGSFSLVFLEDLSRLQEQAQQLKLAALGRLTANIAHEIRNPLSAITHAGDLLHEEQRGPQKERIVQIIRDNAQRLERMVHDVLELSRRDRVQPETIRVRPYLLTFIDEFAQNETIPSESFSIDAAENVLMDFDRAHLNQVLWNLLRNAWRHCRKQIGSVRLAAWRRVNRVELHVIDDGEGVARDLQAQLFEPFFTTLANGTGLGLYIARELCVANGASLDYLDRYQGADFRILWQAP
ncbi:MAG: HAMP domain-containing histidine kinase [Betaproteobacteria bacterium]|nr:MAG: HAMP domain-containing histidine kinase [Betaproteobacteria bacterium]TMG78614.1 MAG: HAMP domain-containing histidine kinase [Betaproteobacteria bacterium]